MCIRDRLNANRGYNELKFLDVRISSLPSPYILLTIMHSFGFNKTFIHYVYFLSMFFLALLISLLAVSKSDVRNPMFVIAVGHATAASLFLMDRSLGYILFFFILFWTLRSLGTRIRLVDFIVLWLITACAALSDSYAAINIAILFILVVTMLLYKSERKLLLGYIVPSIISLSIVAHYSYELYYMYYRSYRPLKAITLVITRILEEGIYIQRVGLSLVPAKTPYVVYASFMSFVVRIYVYVLLLSVFLSSVIFIVSLAEIVSRQYEEALLKTLLIHPMTWIIIGVFGQGLWYYGKPYFRELGWTFTIYGLTLMAVIMPFTRSNIDSRLHRKLWKVFLACVIVLLALHYVHIRSFSASEVNYVNTVSYTHLTLPTTERV